MHVCYCLHEQLDDGLFIQKIQSQASIEPPYGQDRLNDWVFNCDVEFSGGCSTIHLATDNQNQEKIKIQNPTHKHN